LRWYTHTGRLLASTSPPLSTEVGTQNKSPIRYPGLPLSRWGLSGSAGPFFSGPQRGLEVAGAEGPGARTASPGAGDERPGAGNGTAPFPGAGTGAAPTEDLEPPGAAEPRRRTLNLPGTARHNPRRALNLPGMAKPRRRTLNLPGQTTQTEDLEPPGREPRRRTLNLPGRPAQPRGGP